MYYHPVLKKPSISFESTNAYITYKSLHLCSISSSFFYYKTAAGEIVFAGVIM